MLAKTKLVPPREVRELSMRVQRDYQTAYALQHKPLDEFDGHSELQRAKLDQETFAAFVGLQWEPKTKQWRWKGRKNTARNKIIGILAHILAAMLYPFVYAQNDKDEEDKTTARAMRILIEERLRQAKYETRFFYFVLSALVNPALFAGIEFVEELQTIREKTKEGYTVRQVVDEFVSGLLIHIIPIDEMLLGDFYSGTGDIQNQPFIMRVRRLSYDKARGIYSKKYYYKGKDLFDYVEAGKTHWIQNNESLTMFDVESDEADANFVQELTVYYRKDDLQITYVGGIGMFEYSSPYNNPFKHRRMTSDGKSWYAVPVYPFVMGGFEPIDPAGRFVFFKSASFKEFWEDKKITELDRLLMDGLRLDVFKPLFFSGVAKVDHSVMAPGVAVGMPVGASVTPFALGPNLVAVHNQIVQAESDMSQSTQDKVMQGTTEKGITATQTVEARRNARIFLGVFGFMVANIVRQVGELVADIVIQHDTVGELDNYSSGSLQMKYRTILARGKERGKNVTNRMIFSDSLIGRKITKERKREMEFELFDKAGGEDSDQRIWMINPYKFARTKYSFYIDADQIVQKSFGTDRLEKDRAFEKMMDPRALPFIDAEAVVNDFLIEEYSDGDPERYKHKGTKDDQLNALLAQMQPERSPLQEEQLA